VGNRQTLTSTIPSLPGGMNYFYDANDRLTTDTYDNDGNTISSGGTANTYDFENRILTHGAVSIVWRWRRQPSERNGGRHDHEVLGRRAESDRLLPGDGRTG
jgi:hypothetical protein